MSKHSFIHSDEDGPLRIAVLFSGGASGARYLLNKSFNGQKKYEIVIGIADSKACSGIQVLRRNNLDVNIVDPDRLSDDRSTGNGRELNYFEKLTKTVDQFEPDLILLSGFMRVVTPPLLTKYRGRIINVHPADLRLRESGERKYKGTDTVYRSIVKGEKEIRSTVHFVTAGVDEGPILVVSEPVPIDRDMVRTFEKFNREMIRSYADLVQEWMKWTCDGPAIHKALDLIASGRAKVSDDQVYLRRPSGVTRGYYDMEKNEVVST